MRCCRKTSPCDSVSKHRQLTIPLSPLEICLWNGKSLTFEDFKFNNKFERTNWRRSEQTESLTISSFQNQHYSKEIFKWCYRKPLLVILPLCKVSNPTIIKFVGWYLSCLLLRLITSFILTIELSVLQLFLRPAICNLKVVQSNHSRVFNFYDCLTSFCIFPH